MSLWLKDIEDDTPDTITDENLVPVTDEELEEIIEEMGADFLKAIEEQPAPEIDPEMQKILNTEDMVERARLYEIYCEKRGKSIVCE